MKYYVSVGAVCSGPSRLTTCHGDNVLNQHTQSRTNTQMQQMMALQAFLATLNDGLIACTLLHSDKAAL